MQGILYSSFNMGDKFSYKTLKFIILYLNMSFTNRHIVETYTDLLERLSDTNKIELIEKL